MNDQVRKPRDTHLCWAAVGTLAISVLIAYAATFRHDFVDLDDHLYVVENDWVRGGLSTASVWWAFSGFRCQNYQPLTLLSHMADCSLFGLDARGHHVTSTLLHVTNTVLFFLLLYRTTCALEASFVAAFLFGLHPLRVEAVAWIASRKDLLCGLFFLGALIAYSAFAKRREEAAGTQAWSWYVTALLFYGAALLSKPIAVTLPCVLLLFDVWPLRRNRRPESAGMIWRRLVQETVPFFVLSALHAVLTLTAQRTALADLDALPLSARISNAVVFLGWQAWASVCPIGLAASYPFPHEGFSMHVVIGSACGLIAATAGSLALRHRVPACPVGWLWFCGMLVPVLGLFQAGDQGVADRWTYLPGMGLAASLAFTASHSLAIFRDRHGPAIAWAAGLTAFGCVAACLMGLSIRQVSYWRDAESLWRRSVSLNRMSDKALTNLGWALHEKGLDDEAMHWFAVGLTANPRHADCANQLGLLLGERGRHVEAESYFRLAVDARPDLAAAKANLATTLARLRQFSEAEQMITEALRIDPDNPDFHYNYGVMLRDRGNVAAARRHFTIALQLAPDHVAAGHRLRELDRDGR